MNANAPRSSSALSCLALLLILMMAGCADEDAIAEAAAKKAAAQLNEDLKTSVLPELEARLREEIKAEILAELGQPAPSADTSEGSGETPLPDDGGTHATDTSPTGEDTTTAAVTPSGGDGKDSLMTSPDDEGMLILHHLVGPDIKALKAGNAPSKAVFSIDESKIYCFIEADNPGDTRTLQLNWYQGGTVVQDVELEVGHSPNYRTFAFRRPKGKDKSKGSWSCEVLDEKGTTLSHVYFTLE